MMPNSYTLCDYCRKTNFDALRGPPIADMEGLTVGVSLRKEGQEKVELGTLARIRSCSSGCALCSLFLQIIGRQGATYQQSSNNRTLDAENVQFRADPDLSYYGKITVNKRASDRWFVLRRLNVTAHVGASDSPPVALFDHALQVCDIGTLVAPAFKHALEPPKRSSESMPFGGRERPLTLDLQLVRRWMHICSTEHAARCSLIAVQLDNMRWVSPCKGYGFLPDNT